VDLGAEPVNGPGDAVRPNDPGAGVLSLMRMLDADVLPPYVSECARRALVAVLARPDRGLVAGVASFLPRPIEGDP